MPLLATPSTLNVFGLQNSLPKLKTIQDLVQQSAPAPQTADPWDQILKDFPHLQGTLNPLLQQYDPAKVRELLLMQQADIAANPLDALLGDKGFQQIYSGGGNDQYINDVLKGGFFDEAIGSRLPDYANGGFLPAGAIDQFIAQYATDSASRPDESLLGNQSTSVGRGGAASSAAGPQAYTGTSTLGGGSSMPLQGTLDQLQNLNILGMAAPQLGGLPANNNIFGLPSLSLGTMSTGEDRNKRPGPPDRPDRPGTGPLTPDMNAAGCITRCTNANGNFDITCWQDCVGGGGDKPTPKIPNLNANTDTGGGTGAGTNINSDFLSAILAKLENLGSFTDNPLLQQLQAFLSKALEGPFGIDADVLRRSQNAIRGAGTNREQAALQNLAAQLNTTGQLGGGRQIELSRQVSQDTTSQVNDQLQQLALQDALFANESRGQILNSILGYGNTLAQGSAQEIQKLLGISDIELRRLLGEGGLALGQGQLDLQQMQFLFNAALQQILGQLGLLGLG